ncbi:hypothetical protein TWF706_009861 [Orbilia oligospora]|nr:hypothetical protein TWF706_009861 [Orbilia oligospora]
MTVIVVTTKKKVLFASIAGALALSLLNVNAVAGADKYIAIIAGALELWRLIVNVAIYVTTVVRKVTGRGIKSADWGLNVVNLVVGQDMKNLLFQGAGPAPTVGAPLNLNIGRLRL